MAHMATPYAEHLNGRDPVLVLRESYDDYVFLTRGLSPDVWARPLGPGKWTVRQVIVHVTQWEMIFGVRLRFGLGQPGYVVQPFDQDLLMGEADVVEGPLALSAFDAMRRMNLALAESLTSEQRRQVVHHPERGEIDIEDLLVTLAGHGVHHWKQLQPTC
jgi:hypothetical protein